MFAQPLNRPLITLLACAVLVLLAMAGLPRLGMTTDYKVFFGPDNPDLQAHEAFEHRFELTETLIFTLEAPGGADGSVFTPEMLTLLRDMTEAGWQLPWAIRATSLANYQHTRAEGDDIIVESLIPDGAITQSDAERVANIALDAEEVLDRLVSADGSVAGLFVSTALPHEDSEHEIQVVADAAYALRDDFEQRLPGLTIRVTGVTILNDTLGQIMRRDLAVLTPATLAVILVGMLVFFRALLPAILTLGVIGVSVAAALGVAGWAGITLTDVSTAAMLCIMTLAVADCVHFLVTYAAASAQGMDKRAALAEALRVNLEPISVTSLTTAIGFLALNASESPPFADLGNIVAVGVVFAWLLSVAALPAALLILPGQMRGRPPTGTALVSAIGDWVVRRRRLLLPGMAALLLVAVAGISQNRFGENYVEYFPPGNDFREASEFANDRLSGMQVIEFGIPAAAAGGVNDPVYLRKLDELTAWFEQQPAVRKVISPVSLYKRLNKTMHGDDPAWERIPESAELAAQYLLFYELSLPQGLSINNLIGPDRANARFTVLLDTIDSGAVQTLAKRAEAWMADNFPPAMQAKATGTTLMFARISQRNFQSMVLGVGVAVVLIALILIAVFRSVGLGLLSMIPNLLPGLAAYGVWGFTVGKLDMSLSVVGSLSLGILVDDTVHFLSKYRRAHRELGMDQADAVRWAFKTVGTALLATSTMLVVGFLLFTQSDFSMVQNLGTLTAVAIGLALVCDFFFLPPLLIAAAGLKRPPNS
ncbi:MMPL family transporter [bacterium]|nr:MMPL family transporter [bacterium]